MRITATILTKRFSAATNYICQLASGHILTVERHGDIDILDTTQNRLIKTINMLDDDITRIYATATAISSDSTYVVIGIDIGLSSVIKIFQASTNTVCCQFVHGEKITACCISHDNKLIGIGDYRCTVTLYRFDQEIKQLMQIPKECTRHWITQLYFLPGDTDMVIHNGSGVDDNFRIWNIHTLEEKVVINCANIRHSYYLKDSSMLAKKIRAGSAPNK